MKRFSLSLLSLAAAFSCLAGGLFLAAAHPLSAAAAALFCLGAAVVAATTAQAWLWLILILLPVVDLAPWTGWLSFEEFDILALGTAAGAYFRRSMAPPHAVRTSSLLWTLGGIFVLAFVVSFARGMVAAGGFQFAWFEGYDTAMNTLRLAKPVILAGIFLPLVKDNLSRGHVSVSRLLWGMALGLMLAALAALWERYAFPGLTNFSADYRTTALFWEMHVGGAAFDGYLALSVPFAVLLVLRSRRIETLLPALAILALAAYACLTTFSRGVYVAVPLSLAVLMLLWQRQQPRPPNSGGRRWIPVLAGFAWIALTAVAALITFRQGGYRGLAAVLGALALMIVGGPAMRGISLPRATGAALLGLLLGGMTGLAAYVVDKAPYWIFAGLFVLTAAVIGLGRRQPELRHPTSVLSLCIATLAAAGLVAVHWGGNQTAVAMIPVVFLLGGMAIWHAGGRYPLWPGHLRGQGLAIAGVATLAASIAVLAGGSYMGERFASTDRDFGGRLQHWQAGLALLQSPLDWAFGRGLGRFPADFFFGAPDNEFPGAYRVIDEAGNAFLRLSGPRYRIGYGEVLRISQRLRPEPGRYRFEMDGRSERDAVINLELCAKHLLYPEACAGRQLKIPGADEPGWRHLSLDLDAWQTDTGAWFAPRLIVFALSLDTQGGRADVDNLHLIDAYGRDLLTNGDFSGKMGHWFPTSDRHHLPWHMKNMLLHVLFEQGAVGLLALSALIVAALWRLGVGIGRSQPLAPALAASLVGFVVVGLFDSLLDVPRIAFLFLLLLVFAVQGERRAPTEHTRWMAP